MSTFISAGLKPQLRLSTSVWLPRALEHAAIEQIFFTVIKSKEMFGAGDGTGSAVESDFHVVYLSG